MVLVSWSNILQCCWCVDFHAVWSCAATGDESNDGDAPDGDSNSNSSNKVKLSSGGMAGIVIGVFIGALLFGFIAGSVVYMCCCVNRSEEAQRANPANGDDDTLRKDVELAVAL